MNRENDRLERFRVVAVASLLAATLSVTDLNAQLVINEIDYDQPGISDAAEFIELKNVSGAPLALGGFAVELVEGGGAEPDVYQVIALPAISLAADDYFVLCADASQVANCDLDVTPDTNLIRNGAPDAVAVVSGGNIVDVVSYEGDTAAPYVEGSGEGLEDSFVLENSGISRFPDGVDTDQNNVDLAARVATPGSENSSAGFDCPNAGGADVEIFEIQGAGEEAACDGETVTTLDNVVTGTVEDGFYMQTPDERSDGDPLTSDGVFVFTFDAPAVEVGDLVDVTGDVVEFFGLTEITFADVTMTATGMPIPTAIELTESFPGPDPQVVHDLERVEGMVVSAMGSSTGPSDNFGDIAMVVGTDRPFREPGIEFPGLPGLPVWDGNPEVFEVDPDALGLPDLVVNAGQLISASGPMTYAFGDYQILPSTYNLGPEPQVDRPVRPRAPGELTIATLNLFRIYDTVDDPGTFDDVFTEEELRIRSIKAATYITEILQGPDVVALQEVENLTVVERVAQEIQALVPVLSYDAHVIGGNDVGGINNAYLTRSDTIQADSLEQFGADTIFTFDGSLLNDRPPLVLEATYTGAGGPLSFTAIGVHNRSLGGIEDPDDGLRVKNKRLEQAVNLSLFVQELQDAQPTRPIVVLGDFNGYEFTDGYVDVLGQITGSLDPLGDELETFDAVDPDLANQTLNVPADDRYSFLFSGDSEVLDHILTSSALTPLVVDVAFGRGNSDASSSFLLDTMAGPLRASDHDGMVIYVNPGGGGGDLTLDASGTCPGETTISITGGVPGGTVGVIFSEMAGTDPLGAGPCVGTPSGLSNPELFNLFTLDASGEFTLTREAPPQVCGVLLQAVDGNDGCVLSNVDGF